MTETNASAEGSLDARDSLNLPPNAGYELKHSFVHPKQHNKGLVHVSTCSFSGSTPTDAHFLATASTDGRGRIFCTDSGDVRHILEGHAEGINDIQWSVDNAMIATASDDLTVKIWDTTTGACERTLGGPGGKRGDRHTNFVGCIKWDQNNPNILCSGSYDETVMLWDVRTEKAFKILPAHSDPVTSVDFQAKGVSNPLLATGGFDGLIRLWDQRIWRCHLTIAGADNPPVGNVQFSPNGKYLLSSTLANKLQLYALNDEFRSVRARAEVGATLKRRREESNGPLKQEGGVAHSVPTATYRGVLCSKLITVPSMKTLERKDPETGRFLEHQNVLSCGSEDGSILFWRMETTDALPFECIPRGGEEHKDGHTDAVMAVHLLGDWVASCSKDGTAKIWTKENTRKVA